ncbi:hypothetical protein GE061_013355 [Apolygus lucorum]|uniref:Uncharacterized protein n=1 Tax=Apolygus lucorum TaxID=248454 RepID=A0A8S9XPN0_APOLU|nr:hypothetical protein GE061_013355 [Apolygus lucorum]
MHIRTAGCESTRLGVQPPESTVSVAHLSKTRSHGHAAFGQKYGFACDETAAGLRRLGPLEGARRPSVRREAGSHGWRLHVVSSVPNLLSTLPVARKPPFYSARGFLLEPHRHSWQN